MPYGLPHLSYLGYPAPALGPAQAGLGFREGRRADAGAVAAHLASLSAEDRRLRFCASLSDAAVAAQAASLWDRSSLVIVGLDGPLWGGPFHRPGPVRALAELAVAGREAEIGLSVDGAVRRRGVGACLLRIAGALLAPRGVPRVVACTRRENGAMMRLAARYEAEVEHAGGEVEIRFDTAALWRDHRRRQVLDSLRAVGPWPARAAAGGSAAADKLPGGRDG